jgi:hypothetical protein
MNRIESRDAMVNITSCFIGYSSLLDRSALILHCGEDTTFTLLSVA